MEVKACAICGEEFLPLRKVHVRCSPECRRINNRKYQKKYYGDNREDALAKQKRYYERWKEAHPNEHYYGTECRLYYGARDRCKASGLDFAITVDDIKVTPLCPVLKVPMHRGGRYAPSLDRKDARKGYVPDNIWVISKLANRMKNDATPDELRSFAEWAINQSTQSLTTSTES